MRNHELRNVNTNINKQRLTFELWSFELKIAGLVAHACATFLPGLVSLRGFVVFELGARTGRTDGQTDRRTGKPALCETLIHLDKAKPIWYIANERLIFTWSTTYSTHAAPYIAGCPAMPKRRGGNVRGEVSGGNVQKPRVLKGVPKFDAFVRKTRWT